MALGEFVSFKKPCTDYTGPTAFGRENPGIAFQLRLECLIQTWPGTWCSHCIALAFWDPHRGIYSQIGLSDGWIGLSYLLPGNDHNSKSQLKTTSTQPACLSTYLDPVLKENGMWKCKHVVVPMGSHLSVAETGYEATDLVLVIKLYRKPFFIKIGH